MRVGPYEVVRVLGRGGMGVVHLARRDDGLQVAIKVLRHPGADAVARFDRERRLLAAFGEAEGFVPLIDSGTASTGEPYLVMPYLDGGTLRDRLMQGPLGVAATVALGQKLASALGRAHERGVIHRDVKPENVLFSARGEPLLADLGLGKHFRHDVLGASQSVAISREGSMRGTIGYMAPEQLVGEAGPAADVFALGATLHECLSGRPAFGDESAVDAISRATRGRVEPLGSSVPAWLAAVVMQAVEPDPRARPADGHALRIALSGPRRRSRVLPVALGVLLAGGGAALALVLAGPRPPGAPVVPPRPAPPPVTPKVPPAPRPLASVFPPECRDFLESKTARLGAVMGTFSGRVRTMVLSVAVPPDGRTGLVGTLDGLHLFDLGDRHRIRTFMKGEFEVVGFSPDGKLAFGARKDGHLVFFDAATGVERFVLKTHGSIEDACLDAAWTRAVSIGGGFLEVWDLEKRERLWIVEGAGWRVALSPDGRKIVEVRRSGELLRRAIEGGAVHVLGGLEGGIEAVAIAPDSRHFLTGGGDGTVRLWDMDGRELPAELGRHAGVVRAVTISADGKRALSASSDGTIELWDLEAKTNVVTLRGHADWTTACAFSSDGKRAFSGANDGTVRVWDLATAKLLHEEGPGHRSGVRTFAVTADESLLYSAGRDGTVRGWDVATSKQVRLLAGAQTVVDALALSRDGTRLLTGGGLGRRSGTEDRRCLGELILWDTATQAPIARPPGCDAVVHAVALSPSGQLALSAGEDADEKGQLLLWTVERDGLRLLGPLAGHPVPVLSVVFVNERSAISSGMDGTVIRWNLGDRTPMWRARLPSVAVSLVLAPDARTVLAAAVEGVVSLDVETGNASVVARPGGAVLGVDLLDASRAIATSFEGHATIHDIGSGDELDRIDVGGGSASMLPTALGVLPKRRAFFLGTDLGPILRFDLR